MILNEKNISKYKYFFMISVIYMLIFQNFFQQYIKIFQYFDELITVIAIPIIIVKYLFNKSDKYKSNIIISILLIIIIGIGLISNVVYKYQTFLYAVSDVLVFIKFFITIFFFEIIFDKDIILENREKLKIHCDVIIYILLFLTFLNYTSNIFPNPIYRYGIKVNKLFYMTPTYLVAICVFLLALNLMVKQKTDKKAILFLMIILISTLRFKAIGVVIISIIICFEVERKNKKISLSKIGIMSVLIAIVAYYPIKYYFFNNEYARSLLTTKSFEIAKSHFPIGSGFGTFASYFSTVNYSPLYYKYDLYKVHGLVKGEAIFACDVFWPMILAQFGFIGVFLYGICIIIIFRKIQKCFDKDNKYFYIAKLLCFLYLIISSTSESAFVNQLAIPLAFIIGIDTNYYNDKND